MIIPSDFGLSILRVLDLQGVKISFFPFDFAGHRYNSAAATAQPVLADKFSMITIIIIIIILCCYLVCRWNVREKRLSWQTYIGL